MLKSVQTQNVRKPLFENLRKQKKLLAFSSACLAKPNDTIISIQIHHLLEFIKIKIRKY
jgi:hypothetical protein